MPSEIIQLGNSTNEFLTEKLEKQHLTSKSKLLNTEQNLSRFCFAFVSVPTCTLSPICFCLNKHEYGTIQMVPQSLRKTTSDGKQDRLIDLPVRLALAKLKPKDHVLCETL